MRAVVAIAFAMLLPPAVGTVSAAYDAGLEAYSAGEYRRAMQEWREVAEGPADAVVPTIYAETHYAIAMLYWRGEGVVRNYFEAKKWLMRAAELGHAGAMAKIGFMYTDSLTVDQDYAEAIKWFKDAAQAGNVDGLYNLGIFYLYGWGTAPDRTLAKQYLASASALGDPAAEQALQSLLAEDESIEEERTATEAEALPERVEESPAVISDESWILEQDAEHYTIQVMALKSNEVLRDQVEGFEHLAPYAIYQLRNSGETLYVLIQGNYETVEAARAARDVFPRQVERPDKVWIRRFAMIQDRIRGAGAR